MKMADGVEPDGIHYEIVLSGKVWVARVWKEVGGPVLSEAFRVSYDPVCGPDVFDAAEGDVVLERLIQRMRGA